MSLARHTVYNVAGSLVPVAVSLITVPLYLSHIGLDRYGVLATAWIFLGFFNFFDFGLGRAASQRVATLADAPPAERSRTFWTALLMSGTLSAVAMLVFAPAAAFGMDHYNLGSPTLRRELEVALPWIVAVIPFGIVNSLLIGVLEGRQAFGKTNGISIVGSVATAVLPLASAILLEPRIDYLIIASLLARGISLLLLVGVCVRTLPIQAPALLPRGDVAGLLRFGGWSTVTSIIAPFLTIVDRLAIGATISAGAVASYTIPFNLVQQAQILPGALSSALFPRLAFAGAEESREMTRSGVRLLITWLSPFTMAALIGTGPFLYLWLGAKMSVDSLAIADVLLLGLWANSLAKIPYANLHAQGQPQRVTMIHLAESVPHLAILYIAMKAFGVVGAAMAWSIRCAVDALALAAAAGVLGNLLRPLLPHVAMLAAAFFISYTMPLWSPMRWLLLALLLLVSLVVAMRTLPPGFVDRLKRFRLVSRHG